MQITSYKKKDGKTYYMFQAYVGMDPLTGKQKQITHRQNRHQGRKRRDHQRSQNGERHPYDQFRQWHREQARCVERTI